MLFFLFYKNINIIKMNINCYANYFFKTNYNNEKNKIKNHYKFNSQNYEKK